MKRVSVFCGSSSGASTIYGEDAEKLGTELAKKGITVVYGGARVGIMGAVATAALKAGGEVIGVIPKMLVEREVAHTNLTKLFVVDTMHERKAKMEQLSDGFIVLPGGPGTMEEFFEIYTWAQLGVHQKPLSILNSNNYYDKLLTLFDHMSQEQFLNHRYNEMLIVEKDPVQLIKKLNDYRSPQVTKWVNRDQT